MTRGFEHPGHDEIACVRVLELQGLALIVSPVPPGSIEAGLAQEPPDPDWIVPRALHHERVLGAVLERTPVLPVRFGCVFGSESALEDVTRQHLERIRAFLHEMDDREEWSLKAYVDESQSVAFLLDADPVLSDRFRKLPAAPGTRYFLEKQLREEARRRTIRDGKASAERLRQLVEGMAPGVKVLPLRGGEEGGRQLLLRLAILLRRSGKDELFREVDRAATAGEGVPLIVEQSGPWPPYHFCPNLGEPST